MGDKSPRTCRGARCEPCRGHRLHEVLTVSDDTSGKVTRNMTCTACQTTTRLGVCCPVLTCGDARLKTVYTRHRGGTTVRVKRCLSCGHRVRTRETVESAAAVPPAEIG